MNKKTLFLGLGVATLSITPLAIITSCSSDKSKYNTKTDIGNIKGIIGKDTIAAVNEKAKEIKASNNEQKKAILEKQPIIQITTAGKVTDNSFNQMTWEAISQFSVGADLNSSSYLETKTTSYTEMSNVYNRALSNGFKIWVLIGWSHEEPFKQWLNEGTNKAKLTNNNVKIVSIDWDASSLLPAGQTLSLNFKTQESSFVIGYSLSKFLGETFPGDDETNKNKRVVNATGGGDGSGSTNFIYGFLEGVKAWNAEQADNTKKVSSNVYKEDDKVLLNTGYEENNPNKIAEFRASIKGGEQIFKGAMPTFVMPVAGDWSRTAANIIRDTGTKNQQWVIGVDSNMAISYGADYSDFFITSSEKRVGVAVYKALAFLTGITQELGEENKKNLLLDNDSNTWTISSDGKIQKDNANKNWSVLGGIELGLVGASESTISNKEYADKLNQILKETETKFFGESGLLKTVDQTKLDAFEAALKDPGTNNDKLNQAILDLNNVSYGYMTSNNKGFFNLIVAEINDWLKTK